MVRRTSNISLALFLLRFGLGLFLILWAINAIVAPDITVAFFARFYHINLYQSVAMIMGALELVLGLLFVLGMYKTWTYALALGIHSIATLATFQELLSPFGVNIIYVAHVPILFSFISLFLLRHLDNKWALSKKPKMFS